MKLFGRSIGRDASRPALSRGGSIAAAGEWPRSYEAQVREAYAGNAVAQRAVKLVAESVAGAPLSASEPGLLALVEARSGGQALLETLAAQLLLHGNAYCQVLRDAEGARRSCLHCGPSGCRSSAMRAGGQQPIATPWVRR